MTNREARANLAHTREDDRVARDARAENVEPLDGIVQVVRLLVKVRNLIDHLMFE